METVDRVGERAEERPSVDALLIRLGQEIYALPSASVREVTRHRSVTPVPGAPAVLLGIVNQRGTIVTVVDTCLLLGLVRSPVTRATRLVIAAHDDIDMALLVDGVLDLVPLAADAVTPPPPALDPARARLIRGIARHDDQPVILMDLGELIGGLRDWS